jgi:hypothetical protein
MVVSFLTTPLMLRYFGSLRLAAMISTWRTGSRRRWSASLCN